MKKAVLTVLVVFFLAMEAHASPTYGTAMPAAKRSFWGAQYSFVDDWRLEKNAGTIRSHQGFLMWSYGIWDWLSLDLKYSLYGAFRNDPPTGSAVKYDQPMWGGGYGFRVRLYEEGRVKIVTGFQHFSIHPKTVKENGQKHNGILEDWQASAVVSYSLSRMTPYAGIRYTLLDYIHTIDNSRDRINSDDDRRAGVVAGIDIPVTKRVWLNLEGTAGSEGAVSASLLMRF